MDVFKRNMRRKRKKKERQEGQGWPGIGSTLDKREGFSSWAHYTSCATSSALPLSLLIFLLSSSMIIGGFIAHLLAVIVFITALCFSPALLPVRFL
jgi:hypothetical protein